MIRQATTAFADLSQVSCSAAPCNTLAQFPRPFLPHALPMLTRRQWLIAALAAPAAGAAASYPPVVPHALAFPHDYGAHPDFRLEWWYLTGWLEGHRADPAIGFQITFFRTRLDLSPNPSALAAHQLVIAHAAIADPRAGQLLTDERIARAGLGAVFARAGDTDLALDRWRFSRDAASGVYRGEIPARDFQLSLTARPTQPVLLQGRAGWSRKGPLPAQASYYYSEPQLAVMAQVRRDGRSESRHGIAWLDHEWSSSLLDPRAAGWDWIGMNLADGSALTAFQMRAQAPGTAPLWSYAALRAPGGAVQTFAPEQVSFTPTATWISPRTRATWPVAQSLRVGRRRFETRPLMPDQELDSRRTSGAVYWEGASTLLEAGQPVGRGYLEMTGYVAPIQL
ncbi:MAG: lipocalin-like domain-containing protein [Burkholderiaceae bacterium]